jgi:hypothetical protein
MKGLGKVFISFWLFIFFEGNLHGQEKINTVGIQIKPIFSSAFFGTGPQQIIDSSFTYNLKPATGFAAGMVIRRGYTKNLSLEFGINYVRRNYSVGTDHASKQTNTNFRVIGYEIPVSQLVFIRLGKQVFMNVSAGLCLNMFPSDVQKPGEVVYIYGGRQKIFNASLIANLGVEYRTSKSGYYYLGASLNRPFSPIYAMSVQYIVNNAILNQVITNLKGSYLTVDFRYFFHEDPAKKAARKK